MLRALSSSPAPERLIGGSQKVTLHGSIRHDGRPRAGAHETGVSFSCAYDQTDVEHPWVMEYRCVAEILLKRNDMLKDSGYSTSS